jgi:hypothetical protein
MWRGRARRRRRAVDDSGFAEPADLTAASDEVAVGGDGSPIMRYHYPDLFPPQATPEPDAEDANA